MFSSSIWILSEIQYISENLSAQGPVTTSLNFEKVSAQYSPSTLECIQIFQGVFPPSGVPLLSTMSCWSLLTPTPFPDHQRFFESDMQEAYPSWPQRKVMLRYLPLPANNLHYQVGGVQPAPQSTLEDENWKNSRLNPIISLVNLLSVITFGSKTSERLTLEIKTLSQD